MGQHNSGGKETKMSKTSKPDSSTGKGMFFYSKNINFYNTIFLDGSKKNDMLKLQQAMKAQGGKGKVKIKMKAKK